MSIWIFEDVHNGASTYYWFLLDKKHKLIYSSHSLFSSPKQAEINARDYVYEHQLPVLNKNLHNPFGAW